ncbi:MAG: DUF975 family protein [Lachnospiraceae bacterium]|nr:DUF975 family protein [Lachnospiraceae bacterium]
MIARAEHKERAKQELRRKRSAMVGVNILTSALTTTSVGVISAMCFGGLMVYSMLMSITTVTALIGSLINLMQDPFSLLFEGNGAASLNLTFGLLVLYLVICLIIGILLGLVLNGIAGAMEIGNIRFYLHVVKEGKRPSIRTAFDGFNDMVGIMLVYIYRSVILMLWQLPILLVGVLLFCLIKNLVVRVLIILIFGAALIVVRIFKFNQYRMVPYIKADQPRTSVAECMNASKQLTEGHIVDLFVLSLSFLGWRILSSITLGFVGLFHYVPYERLTYAYVYQELKGSQLSVIPMDRGDVPVDTGISPEEVEKLVEQKVRKILGGSEPKPGPKTPPSASIVGTAGMYTGVSFELTADVPVVIGRDPAKSNIVLSSGSELVSGKHCSVCFRSATGEYEVIDYSSNGTLVNGTKISKNVPVSLPKGTIISLASEKNSFRLQ